MTTQHKDHTATTITATAAMATATGTVTTSRAGTRSIDLSLPLWYGLHLNLVEDRAGAREIGSPAVGALVFYPGIIRRYTCDPETGQVVAIDDVAAEAVQASIVGQGWSTGDQEPGAIRFEITGGIHRKVVHIPAGVRAMRLLDGDRIVTYRIPYPDLLWFSSWTDREVWDRVYTIAPDTGPAAGTAIRPGDQLYVPPLFNVGLRSGVVCWGGVTTPPAKKPTLFASPENVSVAERCAIFMASNFKPQFRRGRCQRNPDDLVATWRLLHRARATRYPTRLLVPACTYGDALTGEPRGSLGVGGDWA